MKQERDKSKLECHSTLSKQPKNIFSYVLKRKLPSKAENAMQKIDATHLVRYLSSLCYCLTVFENQRKKSHSTLRAKRATFTFWVDKSYFKMPKMVHFGEFLKTWSLQSNRVTRQVSFIGQKLVENAIIQRFKCDILGDFQTLYCLHSLWKWLDTLPSFKTNMKPFWVIFSPLCHL